MSENPTLQRKLKDLESMLDDAILSGLPKHSHEDIQETFTCIGNLVSGDSTQPQHLHPLTQKLESWRKSFNERDTTFTTFSNPVFDQDSISNSGSSSPCMNDNEGGQEVDDSGSIVFNNQEFVGEKKSVVELRGNVKEKQIVEFDSCLKNEKNNESGFGCVLGCGIGIGMILMGFIMVNICGCFQYVEQTNFAIPT
ncbi:hypothetical protein RYX36_037372 [Vicia faba]